MPRLSPQDRLKLRDQLYLHEGKRTYPYRCTAGKLSIAAGYNIDDRGLQPLRDAISRQVSMDDLYRRGLTDAEIERITLADIDYFENKVIGYLPEYDTLDPIRQRVVVDFSYNLGKRALGFTATIAALKNAIRAKEAERKRLYFVECAYHMMHSLWATQVGDGAGRRYDRAERLSDMIRTGEDYTR